MKQYITKILLFILLFMAVEVFIFIFNFPALFNKEISYNNFMGAYYDKKEFVNTAHQTKGSCVLLAGGSSNALGWNSKEIQAKINKPVANMGLHAGLGLKFILNDLVSQVKKGDEVVLSIEYDIPIWADYDCLKGLIVEGGYKNIFEVLGMFEIYARPQILVDAFRIRDFHFKPNISSQIVSKAELWCHPVSTPQTDPYYRDACNENGDVTWHWGKDPVQDVFKDTGKTFSYIEHEVIDEKIDLIKNAVAQLQQKGCKVYYFYPYVSKNQYLKNAGSIAYFSQQLEKNIPGIVYLNKPLYLDPDLFYDSYYHLSKAGTDLKTNSFIESYMKINTSLF